MGGGHQERRNLTDGRLDMDVGVAPLNQADLRDNPEQLTIRVGNINSFLSDVRIASSNRFWRWIKKVMLAAPLYLPR